MKDILIIKVNEIYNALESAFDNDVDIKFENPISYQDKLLTDIDYYGSMTDKNNNTIIAIEDIDDYDILCHILNEIHKNTLTF